MKKEVIMALSNVLIAFSTFIGVGGATAYYMKEVQNLQIGYIILTEIIYILSAIIILMRIKGQLE